MRIEVRPRPGRSRESGARWHSAHLTDPADDAQLGCSLGVSRALVDSVLEG